MVSSSISNSNALASKRDFTLNFPTKADSKELDFGQFMKKSISTNSSSLSSDINQKVTTIDDSTNTEKYKKASSDVEGTRKDVESYNKDATVSDNIKSNVIDDNKVADVLEQLKYQIKKKFGISDEELVNALANLGITMQDLLQPVNLTNLVTEITGSQSPLALLMNGDLSEQLKTIMEYAANQFETLAKELNVSVDDLKSYFQNVKQTQSNEGMIEQIVEEPQLIDDSKMQVHVTDTPKEVITQKPNYVDSLTQDSVESQDVLEAKNIVSNQNENHGSMAKNNKQSTESKQSLDVVENLTQSIQESFDKIVIDDTDAIQTADVIKQIVQAAKVTATQEFSTIQLQLNPENLGKIQLSVIAKDGLITAHIAAENEAVKKAIENQITVLKENFNNQGIKVDAVEVTIASHGFEANQDLNKEDPNQEAANKKSNKKINLDSMNDLLEDELSDDERRVMNLLNNNNSSVEFSA